MNRYWDNPIPSSLLVTSGEHRLASNYTQLMLYNVYHNKVTQTAVFDISDFSVSIGLWSVIGCVTELKLMLL